MTSPARARLERAVSALRKLDAKPQNVKRRVQPPYSEQEWRELPIVLDTLQAARAVGRCARWASDHAEQIGGKKVGNHWRFSKSAISRYLGIEG